MEIKNKPELLAPAGSFEKAKTAFLYGADAVYCGTGTLSLRSRAEVDNDDLAKTIQYAHSIGKKVYAAINIYAWDTYYEEIKKQAKMLNELKIKHHKIRPRTPEHNGKVERSHRNDNERFYSWLTFYSLEDLRKQGAAYLKRSNRIPMEVLGYLTPKEKRSELMCA